MHGLLTLVGNLVQVIMMLSKTTAGGTKIIQLSGEKFSTMKRSQPLKQLSLKSTLWWNPQV